MSGPPGRAKPAGRALFVTGTDTGVGKTWVSLGLMQRARDLGWRVAGLKPVASGAAPQGGRFVSDDARRIAGVANVELPEEVVSPYLFEPPIAPHLAAEIRGVEVRLEVIASAVEHARERADLLVVEGVGGWRVPLSPSLSVSDLPRRLGLPVVLVVGLRLGCINHAVLTAESIVAHGSSLAGWVGSVLDPAQLALRGNIETLLGRLGAPCLGVIPHLRGPDAHALAAAVALPSPAIAGPRGRTREPPGGAR